VRRPAPAKPKEKAEGKKALEGAEEEEEEVEMVEEIVEEGEVLSATHGAAVIAPHFFAARTCPSCTVQAAQLVIKRSI
jgi:hypothetical protein